jgi:hypothetical protein
MMVTRETEILGRTAVPVPLCPPQIPHRERILIYIIRNEEHFDKFGLIGCDAVLSCRNEATFRGESSTSIFRVNYTASNY